MASLLQPSLLAAACHGPASRREVLRRRWMSRIGLPTDSIEPTLKSARVVRASSQQPDARALSDLEHRLPCMGLARRPVNRAGSGPARMAGPGPAGAEWQGQDSAAGSTPKASLDHHRWLQRRPTGQTGPGPAGGGTAGPAGIGSAESEPPASTAGPPAGATGRSRGAGTRATFLPPPPPPPPPLLPPLPL